MRPPHNTMGPGMPGVNMWALFKFVIMYFNLNTVSNYSIYCSRGPGTGRPWPNPNNANSVSTNAHTQGNSGSDCSQTSSQSGWGLMCSKVLVWDVIVVLCVTVSTDSWTDSHNGVRMIWWLNDDILRCRKWFALPFLVCNVCVFGFRCLTHHPLLAHMGWEHTVTCQHLSYYRNFSIENSL